MNELPTSGLNTAWLGAFHAICGLLALAAGTRVLRNLNKPSNRHHISGGIYTGSMLLTCGSALATAPYTGRFSVFHVLALFVLLGITIGVLPVLRGKTSRLGLHIHNVAMSWSYVALWAALIAELLVRGLILVPGIHPAALWTHVFVAIAIICVVGIVRIHLAPTRRASSRPVAVLQ